MSHPNGENDGPEASLRRRMVREQIVARGVEDPRVLDAMERVPRHLFVPEDLRARAYDDGPLPIGGGQTISQPYIVAFMSEALRTRPGDRVLEIGTGSGYQAAVLATLVAQVYSIEIRPDLARQAADRLQKLGYGNVMVRTGDGHLGWPEQAPFDAIIVTAAPTELPQRLVEQLRPGGRMVIPIGLEEGDQRLVRITRTETGVERDTLLPVRFVPMTGGPGRTD
ncbi:MAG TPA: protein-L-isoaspartate(D-aspartate) O-methyltransferase [Candidatus Polarisedimenticolia bacterium]|nr:protein-L-isoaspartate(D-aspartate) O-methyltransferase [Candidatus Polarisedimenticolia bacterium]